MADQVTITPCPECGGSGYIETYGGPHEPRWDPCPDCAGDGEHICGCRIDPDCLAHGYGMFRVDATPELIARMAARRAER